MFGLLVITLVTIQTQFVPVWDKQRELDYSLEVSGQVATIKADLDRLTGNQTMLPISDPLSLARPQGFTFFSNRLQPGIATFTPTTSNAGMTLTTAHPFAVQSSGGSTLYSLDEDWSWAGSGGSPPPTITNVLSIQHLRVRIPTPAGLPATGIPLSFTAHDSNGNCLALMKIYILGSLSSKPKTFEAQMYAGFSPPQPNCQADPYHNADTAYGALLDYTTPPEFYYLDALAEDNGFAAAIRAIPASFYPLTLDWSRGNMPTYGTAGASPPYSDGSAVSVVYDQATQYGTVRVGAKGQTFANFQQVVPSGTLSVTLPNSRLPPQAYVMEYGAVFLDQPEGSALVIPPSFSVSTALSQGSIGWTFPALGGGSAAVTGVRSATLVSSPTGISTILQGTAQDITFTITTNHEDAWESFWVEKMSLAGLSSTPVTPVAPCTVLTAAPQYSISKIAHTATTAGSATLNFFGPCSAGTDPAKDVSLTFQQASVSLDLRPAG
jgi:hypothetical protein